MPIEVTTSYLYFTTNWLVGAIISSGSSSVKEPEILSVLTKPLTNLIIQIDTDVLNELAINNNTMANATLIKHFCPKNVTTILSNGARLTTFNKQNKCEY